MERGLAVFIGIVSEEKMPTGEVAERVKGVGGVESVYELTGNLDLLVYAKSHSARGLNQLIEKIRALEGVVSTSTYLVLDRHGQGIGGGHMHGNDG